MTPRLHIIGFACVILIVSGCIQEISRSLPPPSFSKPVKVVMISMPDSSASLKLRSRLQKIAHKYRNFSYTSIDVLLLPDDDPRLQYGAPAVLYNGKDIFGEKPRSVEGITARVYSNVVPTEDQIVKSIQNIIHQEDAKARHEPTDK